MATSTTTAYASSDSLTHFKAWAQFISNFFTTAGWTLGADTGQVDWGTIGSVPTSGTWVYEIWNSADAASSVCPITVKLEYGQNASTGPNMKVTVGTGGTNGAGTLNSPVSTRIDTGFYGSLNDSTNLRACYASGDTGSMRVVMFDSGGTGYPDSYLCGSFFISRSYSTSGTVTTEYVQVITLGGAGAVPICSTQVVFNPITGGATSADTGSGIMAALPYGLTSGGYGSNVLVGPIFPMVGSLGNPNINHFVGKSADFSDAASFAMTVYSVSHNYLVWNQHATYVNSSATAVIFRYE